MGRLILASTSTWRRQLLLDAGIRCETAEPDVVESEIVGKTPIETARLRAEAKAQAIDRPDSGTIVVGADQVIDLDGQTIGKPSNDVVWKERLIALRGRTHDLTTAVALVDDHGTEVFHVTTKVRFRDDISDTELDLYIASGEAKGCAGGYMVERTGSWLVESIEGDWLNVLGLPVLDLIGRLRKRGWRLAGGQ
ncbi:MAG: septum formation protein Maf [Deltaproteobacteria bacterium]|nr:septum formation protein Maf [Deltaproteobacteria bacterium]